MHDRVRPGREPRQRKGGLRLLEASRLEDRGGERFLAPGRWLDQERSFAIRCPTGDSDPPRPHGASLTEDFTFVPPAAPQHLDIVMLFGEGIEEMAFTGISLAAEPPWVDPGPIIGPVDSGFAG